MDLTTAFLESAVRASMPLAIAALGETVAERAGFINIGLEGALIAGALAATVGAAAAGTPAGYLAGAGAGAATGLLLAAFAVGLRTNQILAGMAVTAGALGLTALLYRAFFGTGGAALTVPTSAPLAIPVLSAIPLVGRALFNQPPVTYLLLLLTPAAWWWLFRTRHGLALRAVGENPHAAIAAGLSPVMLQGQALLVGSALGGVGGAALVLAQTGTFAEGMSAGRGFIALAVVAVGRWHPAGTLAAALVFGAAASLQHLLQARGFELPYQLFLAIPYVLTLAVLATRLGRRRSPAWLGRPLPRRDG